LNRPPHEIVRLGIVHVPEARRIFEVLGELHRSGTSILLVEQNARAALGLAARGYVLEGGRVVLAGPARELLEDPRVRGAYLGE
jgi:branched-chain amino acid transport system ATP-binding protein